MDYRLNNEFSHRPPVLVHVHIPKTAGTSVWHLLQETGHRHRNLYVNDTHFFYTPAALADILQSDPCIASISSHHIQTFPPYLAGRRMLYFTILRDPVEQVMSYMAFIKKVFRAQTDPNLLACLPPAADALSLREFAQWLFAQQSDLIPFRENYTVNFLARRAYAGLNECGCNVDRSAYRTTRLSLAKTALDQFVCVGLAERMDETMEELRRIGNVCGIDIPDRPIGRENTSGEFRGDLSWVRREDEVGSLLYKSIEEDQRLYDWVVTGLEDRRWRGRIDPHMDAELRKK